MNKSQPRRISQIIPPTRTSGGTIRVGYVALLDAAPLLMAEAMGLFQDAGLSVSLKRELGWGSIREKLVYGELDAAHAPGGLMFSILSGTHSRPQEVSTDMVLSLQGNAITLSRRLWEKGVRDGQTLRQLIRSEAPKKLTFSVVSPFSTHPFLLRKWLGEAGILPEEMRIVFLPPALVGEHLRAGQIDGFCAGEPWNSACVAEGEGWIVSTSSQLAPLHPEKVLIRNPELRTQRRGEYALLRQAILSAAQYCDTPKGREELVALLDNRKLFPMDSQILRLSLIGPLPTGVSEVVENERLIWFSQHEANRATAERAQWILDTLEESPSLVLSPGTRRIFLHAFEDSFSPQLIHS